MIRLFLLALAYFVTGWLGLQIPYAGTHITLVWLPTGIAVAALLRWDRAVWPGIFVGAFLVNLSIGSSVLLASGIAVGNTIGPFLAAEWLRRRGFHVVFDRRKDIGYFIFSACLGMIFSATGGVLDLYFAGLVPLRELDSAWLSWWMGDTVGVLLAAPILLTISTANLRKIVQERNELLIWLLVAVPVSWFTFLLNYESIGHPIPITILTLPLLVWAALRFGVTGSGLVGLGLAILAAWGTATQRGIFFLPDTQASLFLLWAYIATTALTGLLIATLQTERVEVENSLRKNEKQLYELTEIRQAILDGTNFSIISTDQNGIIQIFNQSAERMLGYACDEIVGQQSPEIFHDKDELARRALELTKELCVPVAPGFDALISKARLLRIPDEYEWTYVRKNGTRFPVLLSVTALLDKGGSVIGYLGVAVDRGERQRFESQIRDNEELFRALYESSSEAHMLLEPAAGFTGANLATASLFGCRDIAEFLTLSPSTASPEFQPDGTRSDLKAMEMIGLAMKNGAHTFEWVHQRMDKSTFFAEVLLTRVNIGGRNIIQATVRDITTRKNADEEISKLAFYDALTGLPNRRLLLDRVQHALASSIRTGREGALMFIDLDHFKNLNDTLGHDMGDMLLQQVAKRLTMCVREVDTVARLGGDEFVVMLCDLSENLDEAASQAEKVGMKILAALNKNYTLVDTLHRNTPSIGVTLFTDCKDNMSELLKRADLAMYQAKASGRNSLQFFDSKIQEVVNAHVALENEIRHGLLDDEFILYYQPQIDRHDRVTGAEALIRWNHATRGIVSPVEFISLAEETGLIIPLGHWVLKTACEQLVVWAGQAGRSHLTVAVNVSAIQFRSPNYVETVLSIIELTGANPANLKLEITESTLMEDVDDVIARMMELRSHGISFSLDDFGTGYSSLSYLKRLPIRQLKIDQSFVRDVLTDPNDAIFTRIIISLGQSLGLSVIAEGVEMEEQRRFLFDNNCFEYQGYLFSRPLPINEFEEFIGTYPISY